jgi:hypothetical protein
MQESADSRARTIRIGRFGNPGKWTALLLTTIAFLNGSAEFFD